MLKSCKDGRCIKQCECICYNEETDKPNEICTCGHREHKGYCLSDCCKLIECKNYKYCGTSDPQWVLDMNDGQCFICKLQMGEYEKIDVIEECCICYENKEMIELKCSHKLCEECWHGCTQGNNFGSGICPLCRSNSGWEISEED